jgi:tripartite-type tricarboxylate transporter receptor subunit TctC
LTGGKLFGRDSVTKLTQFAAAMAFASITSLAYAQDYPNGPIRIVNGFPPGSTADISSRVVGAKMSSILGQPIVIENRVGAGSSIAGAQVARAPKDGYTLFFSSVANVFNAAMNASLNFDFYKDFAPIALLTSTPTVLVVTPQLGVRNVNELVAYAMKNPGKLSFGGVGSSTHLSLELFNTSAGTKIIHIAYPGSPQIVTDMLANRIQGYFSPASTVSGQIADGKLVALGVTEAKRSRFFPELPTMIEAGVPDCVSVLWFGLAAPIGTPQHIIDKLAKAANEAIKSEDVVKSLNAQTVATIGSSPDEFAHHIETERRRWTAVVESAGLRK